MRTALLILLAIAAPASANQTVWKWVDDKGVTHYSDRPVPGATRIELRSGNRYDPSSGQSSEQSSATRSSTTQSSTQASPAPAYRNFEIWKPADGEVLINTGGRVPVSFRFEPALQPGHSVHLYLDGKLVESAQPNATTYELQELPRGTHWVQAIINDARGNRVAESEQVTFNLRQESAVQPPVGPTLRPQPPKPRTGANKLPSRQPSYADLNGARRAIDPRTNAPPPVKDKPKAPKAGA